MANSGLASVPLRLLPIVEWIPGYRREWLPSDVLAGIALWAVMVPEGMAYAGIVGVPPVMGLYTIVPALLAYALLGTSRQLVVGPDTATSLISAVTVGRVRDVVRDDMRLAGIEAVVGPSNFHER